MSHTPPLPEASIAPFPAHPAPIPDRADATGDDRKRLIAGAAVGIGSAAIVAALLYASRRPGSSKSTPPAPRRAD